MHRIYIPEAGIRPFLTYSSTVAEDFREWGYRVETESPIEHGMDRYGQSVDREREGRSELLDLWGGEWIRRYSPSSRPQNLASDSSFLGADNFTESVRGVTPAVRQPLHSRWSWRAGLEALGLGALVSSDAREIESAIVEVEVEVEVEVDEEDLPRYTRGEEPPAYRED